MNLSLLLAAAEHSEHTEGVLLGIPTYWFAIIFGVLFFAMFLITISFSGRGIVRPDHAPDHLGADEEKVLKDYRAKH